MFFGESRSHEQDGKKLLRITAEREQQRLAILPWRSNLARSSGRTFSSVTVNARGVLRRRAKCECEMHSLTKRAEFPRA